MNLPEILHSIAPVAAERLLFSLGIGTVLALAVWLLLQLLPKRDSRASFIVWFATLLMTAALPLLGMYWGRGAGAVEQRHAVVTVASWWASAIFLVWGGASLIGLLRVALALLQIRGLRRKSVALYEKTLSPEIASLVHEFRRSRSVELLVSRALEVPTAIGFFKPAIVFPAWLLEGTPADELKFILLHELAHLRRRDDWTNLAQQIVKAVLFFLPSIWWIERKLALEREMACDDAVLASSGTPHAYAECLAHVAERSFLRRQLALAQAAVARLRQLTARVTKILDPSRPKPSQMWKPAVPAVVVVAGLCVFSGSQAPTLISFADGTPAAEVAAQPTSGPTSTQVDNKSARPALAANAKSTSMPAMPKMVAAKLNERVSALGSKVHAWDVALKSDEGRQRAALKKPVLQTKARESAKPKSNEGDVKETLLAETTMPTKLPAPLAPEYVTVREEFFMVVRQGTPTSASESWQVHIVQISVVPAQPQQKQVPRKI
jgi:beta-lactamase regulating signal transducer with metallopeptidase domain